MSGFLAELFAEIGFPGPGAASPQQCAEALKVMEGFGLGGGRGDGGFDVAIYIDLVTDGGASAPANPDISPACRAWEAFSAGLLARADTPMVQFLRGYAIEQGFGMGSDREPTAADCARMLGELMELGFDPDLPDGGWSIAVLVLEGSAGGGESDGAGEGGPSGRYDPRPEPQIENAGWLEEAGYTHAVPVPVNLQVVERLADVAVFFTSASDLLGRETARIGDPQACLSASRLPKDEAIRAWAGMREIMRHTVPPSMPPGGIVSGRDCALVGTAIEASFATLGDPTFTFPDEVEAVVLDRRLDGESLTADELALAGRTVSAMLKDGAEGRRSWQAVFATPDIVEAVTGVRPESASVLVWNFASGEIVARFRMRLSGEIE